MSTANNPFMPSFKDLPKEMPIFPLSGVLLMPFGRLPLNIFEPRYIDMVNDAMNTHRMIGMIQPKVKGECHKLYNVGCAGRIVEFAETDDGRYLVTLQGVSRFRIDHELEQDHLYRTIKPDWDGYEGDLNPKGCLDVDRGRLTRLLSTYFDQQDMSCDFKKFDNTPDGKLMTCLSMVCPFTASEKQALLEQVCCVQRAKLFMNMLEMAIEQGDPMDPSTKSCH